MITFNEVMEYLENVDPDTTYFDDGYAESCPVAKYGAEKYNLASPAFNGTYLMNNHSKVDTVEDTLIEAIFAMESDLDIHRFDKSVTAEQVLESLRGQGC